AVSTRTEITVAAAAISTQSTRGRVNTMSRSISGWAHRRWPTKLMSTRNSSTTTNTKAATKVPTTTVAGGPNVRGGGSDPVLRTSSLLLFTTSHLRHADAACHASDSDKRLSTTSYL